MIGPEFYQLLLYTIIAVSLIGVLLLAAWWLWRSFTGLLRLSGGRPPKG